MINTLTAHIGNDLIGKAEVLYLKTGNPIHVWRAYRIARMCGLPVPSGILAYFDECAEKAVTAKNNKEIADAFGLAQHGGGASKVTQAETDTRDFEIVARFFYLKERPTFATMAAGVTAGIKEHGDKRWVPLQQALRDAIDVRDSDTGIMQQVAEEYGMDPSSVRDIIYTLVPSTKP